MLQKLSRIKITSKVGVHNIMVFAIYSKKRYPHLNFFGPVKTTIKSVKTRKGHLLGKRIKAYVMQTKVSRAKIDNTRLIFFKNKGAIKHRKLQRKRRHLGPISRKVLHKKILFQFPRHI